MVGRPPLESLTLAQMKPPNWVAKRNGMIEYADKLHLFVACVQTLAEARTYLSRQVADREAKALLERGRRCYRARERRESRQRQARGDGRRLSLFGGTSYGKRHYATLARALLPTSRLRLGNCLSAICAAVRDCEGDMEFTTELVRQFFDDKKQWMIPVGLILFILAR
jgi:hypothetical protein